MKNNVSLSEVLLIFLVIFSVLTSFNISNNFVELDDKLSSQKDKIEKLTEQNKAQDVIINKLNTEYNLKGNKQ